jgi:exosortase A-associated hydrolase 1
MEPAMRRMISFNCEGATLAGTLDLGDKTTGLLIVSGGNEIRSGAHAGQAAMAVHFAELGYPVFRYDRRGIGESEGENGGFENSAPDIAAALAAFRGEAPQMERIIAFGNCDAASALALFHGALGIDHLVLANPWVIEAPADAGDAPTPPSAAAIRARYWARLKNPRSLLDLFAGKINIAKLMGGLAKAAKREALSALAERFSAALNISAVPVAILVAERDTTARAFIAAWKSPLFGDIRNRADVELASLASASHSFADEAAKAWLYDRVGFVLRT